MVVENDVYRIAKMDWIVDEPPVCFAAPPVVLPEQFAPGLCAPSRSGALTGGNAALGMIVIGGGMVVIGGATWAAVNMGPLLSAAVSAGLLIGG